jgi:hypothetical protein
MHRAAKKYRVRYHRHVAEWRQITPYPGPVGAGGQNGTSYWAVSASIVACESEFDQYASNSSGAKGWYQLLGKSCFAWDPVSQHRCAAYVLDTEGTGAWAQCGG